MTAAAAGWTNMWGNFGASLGAILVPKLWLLYGGQLGASGEYVLTGLSGASAQQAIFYTLAGAFALAGIAALGMDATKPLLAGTPVTHETILKT